MQLFKEYRRYEYKKLLDSDPNVRRWYFNNAKGSVITADVYLRRLGGFCRLANISPGAYAKLPKRKMEEMAFDFIQEMENKISPETGKKYAPSYVESNLKAILSWAKWNRKSFEMRIKIADLKKRPTIEAERVPTNEELRLLLHADTTPLRTRVSIAIMAFAGCRPEVQGNYLGLEGLRLKDFKELAIKEGTVSFTKVPTLIIVRPELSKSRYWYPTFLLEEGCELVKQFLEKRIDAGEVLTPESGVVVSTEHDAKIANRLPRHDASPFLRTNKITNEIRKCMRAVKLPWRPYVFRSYFDTQQMLAESKGLVSHTYAQAFMGHGGDIESVYTLRKAELPPEILEDMRSSYTKVEELLSTRKPSVSMSEVELMTRRQILLFSEFTEREIDELGDLGKYSIQDLKELDRKKEFEKLGLNGHSTQKIVPWGELRQHIMNGWELVQRLDDTNEAIVKLPK